MGASFCKPECMNSETTTITIKSSCFGGKTQKIIVSNDDFEMLEHIEELLKGIHRKKTMIKEKRKSEIEGQTVYKSKSLDDIVIN